MVVITFIWKLFSNYITVMSLSPPCGTSSSPQWHEFHQCHIVVTIVFLLWTLPYRCHRWHIVVTLLYGVVVATLLSPLSRCCHYFLVTTVTLLLSLSFHHCHHCHVFVITFLSPLSRCCHHFAVISFLSSLSRCCHHCHVVVTTVTLLSSLSFHQCHVVVTSFCHQSQTVVIPATLLSSPSPDVTPSGWLGSKHQLTN